MTIRNDRELQTTVQRIATSRTELELPSRVETDPVDYRQPLMLAGAMGRARGPGVPRDR